MTRVGIYAFYDRDGLVDDGDFIYLNAINSYLNFLIIVINGYITDESYQKLRKITGLIIIRSNYGYDAGAFAEVIKTRRYYKIISKYDELILFNNTVYGPVTSFDNIFKTMEQGDIDFWGFTSYKDIFRPEHIQSYFLAFHKNIIDSDAFMEFWNSLNFDITSISYLVAQYEVRFTGWLSDAGFKWKAFLPCEQCNLYTDPEAMIQKGLPIIKKKILRNQKGNVVGADQIRRTIEIIKANSLPLYNAIENYQKRLHFDISKAGNVKSKINYTFNSASEVLKRINSFDKLYVFGITIVGTILLFSANCKYKAFIESDKYFKTDHQGNTPVVKASELNDMDDDSVCLVTVYKETLLLSDAFPIIENSFSHIVYLYDS